MSTNSIDHKYFVHCIHMYHHKLEDKRILESFVSLTAVYKADAANSESVPDSLPPTL